MYTYNYIWNQIFRGKFIPIARRASGAYFEGSTLIIYFLLLPITQVYSIYQTVEFSTALCVHTY